MLMSCVYCSPCDLENYRYSNTLADDYILETFITENPACQYGVDGIVFDHSGNLYIGNFGDGTIHKLVLNEDGTKVLESTIWASDPAHLKSTDSMSIDLQSEIMALHFHHADICVKKTEYHP